MTRCGAIDLPLLGSFLLHQRNRTLRGKGGDSMLIHHLLAAFAVNNDGKIIKCFNVPANLKSIGQIDGYSDAFFAQLIQECVLNVDGFVHNGTP
jgi:hypothetical protein